MEHSEQNERGPRPEFDRNDPSGLFVYARDKARYLRFIVSTHELPAAIEHLADELEGHMSMVFETLPSVTIESNDVYYTKDIRPLGEGRTIDVGPLPFTGDAELLKIHAITGHLYGFHMGDQGDIRAHVSLNERAYKMMGGVYTPLLSVGVETSDIKLTQTIAASELERIGNEIKMLLEQHSKATSADVLELLQLASAPESATAKKLHNISPVIARIARQPDASPQLIDALFEYIRYRLRLSLPHGISATSYREVITTDPIPAYRPRKEPKHFVDVVPELGLIGESANRSLGLLFISDEKAVQIPVQYITSIYHSEGQQ